MRQKTVFITLAVTMLYSATAYAQKVVTEGSGKTIKVIIDATGMPSGAITTIHKPLITFGSNNTACTQDDTDLASNISNERVYHKFEVSKIDNDTRCVWDRAVNIVCSGTINGSTGWRLPTQRELMLIWVLHSQLKKVSGFTPLGVKRYWSATENGSTLSWNVDFSNGATGDDDKASGDNRVVRCVRDI